MKCKVAKVLTGVMQQVTNTTQIKIWNYLPLSNDSTYKNVPFLTTCPLL